MLFEHVAWINDWTNGWNGSNVWSSRSAAHVALQVWCHDIGKEISISCTSTFQKNWNNVKQVRRKKKKKKHFQKNNKNSCFGWEEIYLFANIYTFIFTVALYNEIVTYRCFFFIELLFFIL